MDNPNDRLRAARLKAGYPSASEAARAFGWRPSTYIDHENGSRKISRDLAEKYARAFHVKMSWLLKADPGAEADLTVKVRVAGKITASEAIDMIEDYERKLEEIALPFGFPAQNARALIAVGNAYFPRVKAGEVLIFDKTVADPADLVGEEAVVKLVDGPYLLKTIRPGTRPGLYHLESANGPLREDCAIEWAGPVLATIRARAWRAV